MEAMTLLGVKEADMDRIILKFEEEFEKYSESLSAVELAAAPDAPKEEEYELGKIEMELLGGIESEELDCAPSEESDFAEEGTEAEPA